MPWTVFLSVSAGIRSLTVSKCAHVTNDCSLSKVILKYIPGFGTFFYYGVRSVNISAELNIS